MAEPGGESVVVLFDVDDTLLNNDEMESQLDQHLVASFGEEAREDYREHFDALRQELGYADFLGAVERFRMDNLENPDVLRLSRWFLSYPFQERLFPEALDAVRHARTLGTSVILSDGDGVYQPHKIASAGLASAFEERVLIFVHKEEELSTVEALYPADRYVMIDDKISVLSAMKEQWRDRLTTVLVRQGHYGRDAELLSRFPEADVTVDAISSLRDLGRHDLIT
jgi:hypothetical protein